MASKPSCCDYCCWRLRQLDKRFSSGCCRSDKICAPALDYPASGAFFSTVVEQNLLMVGSVAVFYVWSDPFAKEIGTSSDRGETEDPDGLFKC